jgi:hypothetical protein
VGDLASGAAPQVPDVVFAVGLACDAAARAPLARGRLDALPILSGSLTGALCAGPPDSRHAREIARVLQPGGRALVVVSDETPWADALRTAGFVVEEAAAGVVLARKPGGAVVDIPRPSLLSMFIPRRWLKNS